ncbi:MAG: siderophore-interacting protein, partial [Nitrososphaerales archaeon]
VRVLLPEPPGGELVLPTWSGNEFLTTDGHRPLIRTFTPRRLRPEALELDVQIVVHGQGAASDWSEAASTDDPVAVSGPRRGYVVDVTAQGFLLLGDETAMPAMCQLLEELPDDKPVEVHIEIADPVARIPMPAHPRADIAWHELAPGDSPCDSLVAAAEEVRLTQGARVWAAGEAAAVQRIRRSLFDLRGWPRQHASVRGYWKQGRTAESDVERGKSAD